MMFQWFALVLVVLAAGCTNTTPGSTPQVADEDRSPLVGTRWHLVEILSMDDSRYTPDPSATYSIELIPEGNALVQADCNRGRGEWQSDGPGQLQFGTVAMTRAYCGANPVYNRFVKDLAYVRSYVLKDGRLYLATMADGSILEFSPLETTPSGEVGVSPSFQCDEAGSSAEKLVCEDAELARLDLKLDNLFSNLIGQVDDQHAKHLRAFQRGWIKGRDDCWKSDPMRACVLDEYERRITELEIQSGAVMVPAPVDYQCGLARLSVYFYNNTTRDAAVLNLADGQVLAFRARSASGSRYLGRNLEFWIKGDEASLTQLDELASCNLV